MINIVYDPSDNWILKQMAEELLKYIPNSRPVDRRTPGLYKDFSKSILYSSDTKINYYMNYYMFECKTNKKDIGWFTHPKPGNENKFFEKALKCDYVCCHAKKYSDEIRARGQKNTTYIIPGIDSCYKPKLVLGFVGRWTNKNYQNRKGKDLLENISNLPFITLKSTEGKLTKTQMPDFYNSVDYILVTSRVEGGPMCITEGIACGKKIICPHSVGVAEFFKEHIFDYKIGDIKDLTKVLEELFKEKEKMYESVKHLTWKRWADEHNLIFKRLVS